MAELREAMQVHSSRSRRILFRLIICGLLLGIGTTTCAQSNEDLADRVDILAEELAQLREQMDIPETEEERLEGRYGMSPVASKVYGSNPGLSMGGYGEFYFASQLQDVNGAVGRNTGDFYRFVTYLGYKFNDHIIMNAEIEFEHATTSSNWAGKSGSVSVEFAYLDFLIARGFNLRTGNLLLPMGFINTLHEPVFYRGNFRPTLERTIIPTTWRELGLGAHGSFGQGFQYTAYLVNGLDGAEFSDTGIRDGRQKGNRVAFEDIGLVGALDWDYEGKLWLGGSYYHGGADQNGMTNDALTDITVTNWIGELHGQYRHRGFEARAIYAASGIDGANQLTGVLYEDPNTKLIPEAQRGWYVDVAYDFAPLLFGHDASFTLTPWVRYEDLQLQSSVPTVADRRANPALDQQILTIGLESKPHQQVVLKLDYVQTSTAASVDPSDEIRLGAGFVY